MFVDQIEITVEAGHGGNGAATFRREKFVPRGGPSGGDGGRGGSIILRVDGNLSTLLDFRYHRQYRAESGCAGMAKKRDGQDGKDLILSVPPGTIVTDLGSGQRIADLIEVGQEAVVAAGGAGGRGNLHFTSSVRQAPRFAELGAPGERRRLRLDLKLVADVGVIGLPSVGKSTLIAAVSAARPKIAEYPFTTLTPNLGLVGIGMGESFVLADMPGLIEGAHVGAGLGDRFLRHVDRTSVLIHMLDASGLSGRDPIEDFQTVNAELSLHSPELAARSQIVALNKVDLAADRTPIYRLIDSLERNGWEVYAVSAAAREGLDPLMLAAWRRVQAARSAPVRESVVETAPHVVFHGPSSSQDRHWEVGRDPDGGWRVEGAWIERLVGRTDLNNDAGLTRLQYTIEKAGIHRKLREMGAQDQDIVRVGQTEFVFDDEDVDRDRRRRRRQRAEPA